MKTDAAYKKATIRLMKPVVVEKSSKLSRKVFLELRFELNLIL